MDIFIVNAKTTLDYDIKNKLSDINSLNTKYFLYFFHYICKCLKIINVCKISIY